jgi:hypothetical protein
MKAKQTIDPIKSMNKKRYLNNISLKCRYEQMEIKQFCKEKLPDRELDSNLFKVMSLIKLYEDGIVDSHARPRNCRFTDMCERSMETIERIQLSGVYNTLDVVNHTERHNLKHDINQQCKEGMEKRRRLQPIYLNYKMNERRQNKEKSKEAAIHEVPPVKYFSAQKLPPLSPIKDKRKRLKEIKAKLLEYGKLQVIPRKSAIFKPNDSLSETSIINNESIPTGLGFRSEYDEVIVGNEKELVKNYLIHPCVARKIQKKRTNEHKQTITLPKESLKALRDIRHFILREDSEKLIVKKTRTRNIQHKFTIKTRKLSKSFDNTEKEHLYTLQETVDNSNLMIKNSHREAVDLKNKELDVYVVDNLNALKKLNNHMLKNFDNFFEIFESIKFKDDE